VFDERFLDLYAVPRMNETRLKRLLGQFGTPDRVLGAGREELLEVKGVDAELADAVLGYERTSETERQIQAARATGCQTLAFGAPDFPASLKELAHMPPVLFARGSLVEADRRAVAVVGTRQPTVYGRQMAERLGQELAASGVTVVSGLARGIDTFAHRGALAAGGRTVAVLGSGLDVCYPPENRRLRDEIAERGAVLSEFTFGTGPLAMNFPKRNRVVSGLGQAVVAVEAGEKSGVLNTVAWAQDQGRVVFAVPGNLTSPKSVGTDRLIRDGARPLLGVEDVLTEIGVAVRRAERREIPVTDEEKPVLDFLTAEPKHIDEVCDGVGMPVSRLLSVLLQLELKGLVRQMPGKLFVKEV
jgi:DNA processing protein